MEETKMAEKKGIDSIMQLLSAVELLVKTAKTVLADGKVSLADLPAAIALLEQVQTLVKAVEGIKEIVDEGKDLDAAEIVQVVTKVKALVDAVRA